MALGWRKNYYRYKGYFLNIYEVYKRRPDLKVFLELLLTLATISFFLVFALRPTVLAIVELTRDIRAKEETISKMDTKIQNLQTAQRNYVAQNANLELLETAIPNNPQPDLAVRQLEGLANNSGVAILGLNMGEAVLVGTLSDRQKKANDLESLPQDAAGVAFSISVTGPYPSLQNFLSNLNNMRRPAKIDSLNINSSQIAGGAVLVIIVNGRLPYIEEGVDSQ